VVDKAHPQVSDMAEEPEKQRNAQLGSHSTDGSSARIFISYARQDGDWWSQIDEAIRSKALEHFVLVVTPAVLESLVRAMRENG
jgi:hypothetical protein